MINGLPLPEMLRTHEYRQYSLERFMGYIDLREQVRLGIPRDVHHADLVERKDDAEKRISVLEVGADRPLKSDDDDGRRPNVHAVVESKEEEAHVT
jgi:hypothetical protein